MTLAKISTNQIRLAAEVHRKLQQYFLLHLPTCIYLLLSFVNRFHIRPQQVFHMCIYLSTTFSSMYVFIKTLNDKRIKLRMPMTTLSNSFYYLCCDLSILPVYHCLSGDTTIMVSHKCEVIDKQVDPLNFSLKYLLENKFRKQVW